MKSILSATTVNIGGLPIPVAILVLGAVLVGAAIIGSVVFALVSKAKKKGDDKPSEFEQMVLAEMEKEGVKPQEEALPQEEDTLDLVEEEETAQPESVEEAAESVEEAAEPESEQIAAEEEADVVETDAPVATIEYEDEAVPEEAVEEEPLVKKDEEPIAYTEDEEDVPDLIPPVRQAEEAPAVAESTPDTTEEEDEIALAAVDTAEEADKEESLLSSMTDQNKDYGDFDFGGDFDEWEEEPDEPEDEEEVNILAELDIDDEEYDAEATDGAAVVAGAIVGSKYRRSFRSKLIQGSAENKEYYSIIKNELLSYEKTRCNESWSGETYMQGRRTFARMGVAGKTLCVFLALDPKAYADVYGKLRFRDVSNVRKYASTPMLMRVKSDLSLRRTLRLIMHVAAAGEMRKKAGYAPVNYQSGLEYRSDRALQIIKLIKLNPRYVQVVDTAAALEAKEAETRLRPALDVTPIKKDQVGNLTEEDFEKMAGAKKERVASADRPYASETGKFVIEAEGNIWHFIYYAPNGKLLAVGEGCSSKDAAFKSAGVFRTTIQTGEAVVNTVDDEYFYTVRVQGGRVFSSVMYESQSACLEGLRLARETAAEAVVEFSI